mgnify:CR=1 FL=1
MPISKATITAKTNGNVPVKIEYLNGDQEYELVGDGVTEKQVDNFGEYSFTFKPEGFSIAKEEIRNINQFINNLDFMIDDNYSNCII